MTDVDLSLFSDLYKDLHGFRPKGFSVEMATNWLAWRLSPAGEAGAAAQFAEEEAEWEAFLKQEAEDERWYAFQHSADDPDEWEVL
tara:strand:+ start:189 stop:446 length:258 start_codon:yes stop_codon:yes gene_type:complete